MASIKTIVPVRLAKYGEDQLVSRSQAKRLLSRFELFSVVVLDFSEIETIGQAFADQIFRVFATDHPEIQLQPIKANAEVLGIINAAIRSGRPGFKGALLADSSVLELPLVIRSPHKRKHVVPTSVLRGRR